MLFEVVVLWFSLQILLLITVVLNAYLRCLHKFNKKAQVVVCTQPLTEFTLGKRSLSTDEQVQILSSCIWDSFPVGGWERRIAKHQEWRGPRVAWKGIHSWIWRSAWTVWRLRPMSHFCTANFRSHFASMFYFSTPPTAYLRSTSVLLVPCAWGLLLR